MTPDETTLKSFRAFHRVVTSLASTPLWQKDELTASFLLSGGPGLHVHRRDFPDLERFRSLMMDFRQLLNNDDLSNINRTCNLIFKHRAHDGWSDEQLATVADARKRFNEALDQEADFWTGGEGQPGPKVRTLLEDWISGDWFHPDEERRQRRLSYELSSEHDLSLALVIPAVREAVRAAIQLDSVIKSRFAFLL